MVEQSAAEKKRLELEHKLETSSKYLDITINNRETTWCRQWATQTGSRRREGSWWKLRNYRQAFQSRIQAHWGRAKCLERPSVGERWRCGKATYDWVFRSNSQFVRSNQRLCIHVHFCYPCKAFLWVLSQITAIYRELLEHQRGGYPKKEIWIFRKKR
jgi:hypothetical protein